MIMCLHLVIKIIQIIIRGLLLLQIGTLSHYKVLIINLIALTMDN